MIPSTENNSQSPGQVSAALVQLRQMHGNLIVAEQATCDGMPTVWIERQNIDIVLRALRDETTPRFEMLFDLTAIDERLRSNRTGQPDSEFTVVYHLMSFSGNCDTGSDGHRS